MVDTGLAEYVLPEVPAMRLEIDEHHQHKDVYTHSLTVLEQAITLEDGEPDLVLRLAALLHDIGKPATRRHEPAGGVSFHHHEVVGAKMARKRLRALRYPTRVIDDVATLVFLHLRFHGYGGGEWTDSAVRRYVTDAGDLLPRLNKLVRADCTTRNRRKAVALQRTYDDLESRADPRRGGPRGGAPGPGRQRDHGAARVAAGSAGRSGLATPQGGAFGPGPAVPRAGRGGAAPVGAGQPS
jgi:poly(A) polymerase